MPNEITVLIVDDEVTNRLRLRKILSEQKYTVIEAEDGIEALEQLKHHTFDCVLLDIMMPNMDGLEFCRKVRQNYSLTELPILMVTAKDQDEDLVESFTAGANDFIRKPINKTIVLSRLRTQLQIRFTTKELLKVQEKIAEKQRMETVGVFAAGIAHNFNNLLGTVMGSAELIKEITGSSSNIAVPTDLIVQSAKQAARLTDAMLTFSNPDRCQDRGDPLETTRASVLLMQSATGSRIDYQVETTEDLPKVAMSTINLSTVLLELLRNGVEAIAERGVIKIYITYDKSSKSYPLVVFRICDSGCGISEQNMCRIFEPFFSTKNMMLDGPKISFDGSGLGLSVVYNLVTQTKGSVEILDTSGQGTTVQLSIPAAA